MINSSGPLAAIYLVLWVFLWLTGGFWLARGAFRLEPREELIAGAALGWITQTWLANLLVRILPVTAGFWLSGVMIFLVGVGVVARQDGWKGLLTLPAIPFRKLILQVAAFAGLLLIFLGISRGLAIFDDFEHLPTISLMAVGDIPPHFALDPQVPFYYHYFLDLLSAQLLRIIGIAPWTVVDVARALSFTTAVMLSGLFARRLTRSLAAGVVAGMMMVFASGTRWLLLFFPSGLNGWLGRNMQLLGSGIASGADLSQALASPWAVEGVGPMGFPFAFANGVLPPGNIQGLSANGLTAFALIFMLLLTYHRWRGWAGGLISVVLVSVWGLLGEAELAGLAAGWGLVTVAYMIEHRTIRLPRSLCAWLGVVVVGGLVGVVEGGAWTEVLLNLYHRISGAAPVSSYQTIGFHLSWLPAIVSSHLGILSLVDPAKAVVALFEVGPVLFVYPFLLIWGWKSFRAGRWYEAASAATALVMLLTLFVQFSGSAGVRNTPRLYVFLPILMCYAVPLVWIWARHRTAWIRTTVMLIGLLAGLGGMVMFGIELLAIQRPVYSTFLTPLDAQMAKKYWNRLEPGALIFDPTPYRAPTVFGRYTNSSLTWYAQKTEWLDLYDSPSPEKLHAAGYRYVYLDNLYWEGLGLAGQKIMSDPCAKVMDNFSDWQQNFRRLLDLSACQ
jgi:hypothetical protein